MPENLEKIECLITLKRSSAWSTISSVFVAGAGPRLDPLIQAQKITVFMYLASRGDYNRMMACSLPKFPEVLSESSKEYISIYPSWSRDKMKEG